MLVQIFKVGEQEIINTLQLGSHVVGRGTVLQCNDKRVSRNHATIEVTDDNVKITSTHINPCFLKAEGSKTITILKKDSTAALNNGDRFALLPDDSWFEVKIVEDDASNAVQPKNKAEYSEITKNPVHNNDDVEPLNKKRKVDQDENIDKLLDDSLVLQNEMDCTNNINQEEDNIVPEPIDKEQSHNKNNQSTDSTGIQENSLAAGSTDKEHDCNDNQSMDVTELTKNEEVHGPNVTMDNDVAATEASGTNEQRENSNEPSNNVAGVTTSCSAQQEDSNEEDDQKQGTSKPVVKREKCWYGATCYRKNPVHGNEFSHPGDSDFESDSNDDRPSCSFGAECYRKNKDHRMKYKHPPKIKKKRNRKKVDRLNAATSQDMRELSEQDSEDPFGVDDDSDEYIEETDTDDSDWEESQETDDDNVKRLVKEANRFMKK